MEHRRVPHAILYFGQKRVADPLVTRPLITRIAKVAFYTLLAKKDLIATGVGVATAQIYREIQI